MSPEDLLRQALQPINESDEVFAADKREHPRQVPAPVIRHLELPYRQWDGPPLPWSEDFGKKSAQVYSRDGGPPTRSCNEIEVAKRLLTVRDHAFWISCYSPSRIPSIWRPWTRGPSEMPLWLRTLDQSIRLSTGHASGGIPDVVAWNDHDPERSALFIECKGPTEPFKEGQEDWVAAALQFGILARQIAVAIRRFVYG